MESVKAGASLLFLVFVGLPILSLMVIIAWAIHPLIAVIGVGFITLSVFSAVNKEANLRE